jgi:hypothetical protein
MPYSLRGLTASSLTSRMICICIILSDSWVAISAFRCFHYIGFASPLRRISLRREAAQILQFHIINKQISHELDSVSLFHLYLSHSATPAPTHMPSHVIIRPHSHDILAECIASYLSKFPIAISYMPRHISMIAGFITQLWSLLMQNW